MKNFIIFKKLSLSGFLILTSCLAAGVPYTSDPKMKLSYALQMDTFGRCIPATKLAKEALKDLEQKNDKVGTQYSYLVLSINSEVKCSYSAEFSSQISPSLSKDYFLKAVAIDIPKEHAEAMVAGLFSYLQSNKNLPAVEVYHKYKIIQFYHRILAEKYGSKDSAEKVKICQNLINKVREQIPNREYYYDFSLSELKGDKPKKKQGIGSKHLTLNLTGVALSIKT